MLNPSRRNLVVFIVLYAIAGAVVACISIFFNTPQLSFVLLVPPILVAALVQPRWPLFVISVIGLFWGGLTAISHPVHEETFASYYLPILMVLAVQLVLLRMAVKFQNNTFLDREKSRQQLRRKAELESIVSGMSSRLIRATPDEVNGEIKASLTELSSFLGAWRCSLMYVDQVNGGMEIRLAVPEDLPLPDLTSVRIPPQVIMDLAQNQVVHLGNARMTEGANESALSILQTYGVTSLILAPLMRGTSLVGVLAFGGVETTDRPPGEFLAIIKMAARLIDDTLENKRLQETSEKELAVRKQTEQKLVAQAKYLEALYQTTLSLVHRKNVKEALQNIVARICEMMGTLDAYLYLTEENGQSLKLAVTSGIFIAYDGFVLPRGAGMAGRILDMGQPMIIHDYETWEKRYDSLPRKMIHALAGVPIQLDNKIVGVIGVGYRNPEQKFNTHSIDLLNRFGHLASIALDNAHLYETARRELARRKESEELAQFQSEMVNNATEAIFGTDTEFRIVSWNKAAESIFGWSAHEALGNKTLRDLFRVTGVTPGAIVTLMREFRETGKWRGELLQTASGLRARWLQSSATWVLNEDGKRIGMVAVSHDITQRKEFEQELSLARDQALAASEAKSNFLAVMSHEIRTPLNVIGGMSEILQDEVRDDALRDYAQTIHEASGLLSTVLNDALDFSKIESGKMRILREEFNPAAPLQNVAEMFTRAAEQKKIRLVTDVDEACPRVWVADSGRVHQVLNNLVSNAVKFTSEGEVRVSLSVLSSDADGQENAAGHLLYEVSDTGIGISDDMKARLFLPFSQAEGFWQRQYGGTGLGLAICKRLVEAMGGQIGFDSVLDKGSSFWFTLPSAHAAKDKPDDATAPA